MGDSLDDLLGLNRDGAPRRDLVPGAGSGSGLPSSVWGTGAEVRSDGLDRGHRAGGWTEPARGTAGSGAEGDAGSVEGAELRQLPLEAIVPSRRQPRTSFDERELDELAASVASLGVLQPVLVRQIDEYRYELVAGERRWRAAKRAGLQAVPAVVRQHYVEAMQGLIDRYKRELGGAGIDYQLLTTKDPLELALMQYLSTRERAF